MRAVTLPSTLTTYLPRDVFLCFSTFFATSTGLSSDVPEAAALSFCFLVAIVVSSSRASVSRTALCSASCCCCPESLRARAPLRRPAPRSLPRWAHSKCHHRFCGLCRLGRRREAKERDRAEEPLGRSRPTASYVRNATRCRKSTSILAWHWASALPSGRFLRCQAPKRERDDVSTCLAVWLAARHDRRAGGRPVNHTYRP